MSDAHIARASNDIKYWCRTAVHGYDFWKRYLNVFDEVNVVARVQIVDSIDEKTYTRADGDKVHIIELPFVRGTKGYLQNYFKLRRLFKGIITDEECGVFRLPSLPTFMLLDEFKKLNRPYAIEVIVDPEDSYKTNWFAAKILSKKLIMECLNANGVSYVTKEFLEKKYPCKALIEGENDDYFSSYYSSIKLDESFFGKPKQFAGIIGREIRIIHICSAINSDVKGHSSLLKIARMLKDRGINYSLKCIGDGDKRRYYEDLAENLGVGDRVRFLGLFSDKAAIRTELINSDLMVFPTRAEGLPRVLIEAMAVGLPCLSTPVNGIPELLNSEYLFNPDDVEMFADMIEKLIHDPDLMEKMSNDNIIKAAEYVDTILQGKRDVFYSKLRDLVENKQ